LIYHIHDDIFDSLPNDWIYSVIYEAFEELSRDKLEDITIEADSYTSDLYEWFGHPFAVGFCNEYMGIMCVNCTNIPSIYEIIAGAQGHVKTLIYEAVDHFLTEENRHE